MPGCENPVGYHIYAELELLRRIQDPPGSTVVVGHGGIWLAAARDAVNDGKSIVVVGLREHFDEELTELAEEFPQRCRLLDLEYQVSAVRLPVRMKFDQQKLDELFGQAVTS
jgi:hypothetical protein